MGGKVARSIAAIRKYVKLILEDVLEDESFLGIYGGDNSQRAIKLADIAGILGEGRNTSWVGSSGQVFGKIALPRARWNLGARERYMGAFRVKTKIQFFSCLARMILQSPLCRHTMLVL
jgi:hypothetical protein